MLISKFHKLIQSRVLWIVFLVIIIFTFVIWGIQWPSEAEKARAAAGAGKLDGQVVSIDEFNQAYNDARLQWTLAYGRTVDSLGDRAFEQIRRAAWHRLIELRETRQMALTATTADIISALTQNQMFSENGQFNRQAYDQFALAVLNPMGFSKASFERYIGDEIKRQKLNHLMRHFVLVAPLDIERTFHLLNDKHVAAYVAVTRADVEGAVSVSEAEARAWYTSNPEQFREPETRVVKYVAFPAKDFLASVEIPEEDALDYYNEHIDRYTRAVENGPTTNIPFAEAKSDVIAAMTQEAARLKASDAATDFAVSLAPVPGTTPPSFEAAAAQIKKPVQNLGPFAMGRDDLKGIENPIEFQRAAFQLAATPDEYFSNAITGSNTAYVVALDRIIATHIPAYETIAADVMKVVKDNAVRKAMQAKATEVRDRITKAMQKGATFKDAATAEGLQPVVTPAFSMSERLEKDPYAPAIVQGVIGSNPGEVADPIPTQDAVVVVSLVERTPADLAAMGALREELVRMLQQSRGDLLYQSWMMDKLSPAKFVDSIARAAAEEDSTTTDDQ